MLPLVAQAPAPAQGLSPQTAFISAAALILVGIITNVVQAVTANRSLNTQRQQYQDQLDSQRERDKEEREEQRRRDRELWDREDRHRFTNDKRSLYTQYLRASFKLATAVDNIVRTIMDAEDRQKREGLPALSNYGEWLHAHQERAILRLETDNTLADQVDMIAPRAVGERARSANRLLLEIQEGIFARNSIDGALDKIDLHIDEIGTLRDEMRRDLTGSPAGDAAEK